MRNTSFAILVLALTPLEHSFPAQRFPAHPNFVRGHTEGRDAVYRSVKREAKEDVKLSRLPLSLSDTK